MKLLFKPDTKSGRFKGKVVKCSITSSFLAKIIVYFAKVVVIFEGSLKGSVLIGRFEFNPALIGASRR